MFRKFKWPEAEFNELKKRTRILVIDDNPFEYEKLFKDAHYAIDKWDDVKDISTLENGTYDIILLDIQGVGKDFSKDQGFGVLKHLKKVNPAQIIIAYSNSDYKLGYQDFFRMANDTLEKSQDFYIYKEKIDQYIKLRFSYEYNLELISNALGGNYNQQKIIKYFNKSVMNGNPLIFKSMVESFEIPYDKMIFLMNVISFAISTYSALQGVTQ